MSKVLSFTLLTLLFAVMFTSVPARALDPNTFHADFVHMTQDEQDKFIVKLMQLMVDLEAQHQKQIVSGEIHTEKFREYTKILNQLRSLLIADAHAVNGDWESSAATFARLLSSPPANGSCIFAGQLSRLGPNNMCQRPSSPGCPGSQVACNPVIYGFKAAATNSPICVRTDDVARNSSLDCMKLALSPPANQGYDSAEQRREFLKRKLSVPANAALANQVYRFVYQTCLCPTAPTGMNESYQDRIQPHRTCYGMMQMMNNLKTNCELPVAGETAQARSSLTASWNGINFNQLLDTITVNFSESRSQQARYDSLYGNRLTEWRTANAAAVTAACGAGPREDVEGGNECVATCTTAPGANGGAATSSCSSYRVGGQSLNPATPPTIPASLTAQTSLSVTFPPAQAGGAARVLNCSVSISGVAPTGNCTAQCTRVPGANGAAGTVTCSGYKRGEAGVPDPTTAPVIPGDIADNGSFQAIILGSPNAVACTAQFPAASGKSIEVTVVRTSQTNTQATFTATVKLKDGTTETPVTETSQVDSVAWTKQVPDAEPTISTTVPGETRAPTVTSTSVTGSGFILANQNRENGHATTFCITVTKAGYPAHDAACADAEAISAEDAGRDNDGTGQQQSGMPQQQPILGQPGTSRNSGMR